MQPLNIAASYLRNPSYTKHMIPQTRLGFWVIAFCRSVISRGHFQTAPLHHSSESWYRSPSSTPGHGRTPGCAPTLQFHPIAPTWEAASVAKTVFGALRHLLPSLRAPAYRRAISARPREKEDDMPIGKVKFFNTQKGFGFIQPEDGGNDAFVHISAVERAGMNSLVQDQRVSYELETDQRGKTSAVKLENA
jgi:CspA family cold shock protein